MADVEIEVESGLEDLEINDCSEPLNVRKLLSREEKLFKVQGLLTTGFLFTFKSAAKLDKELLADKSCFQK